MARFPRRLQELCGFGIFHGLIGHIDKSVPADRLFGPGGGGRMLWDSVPATDD